MQPKLLQTAGLCMLDFSLELHVKNGFPIATAVYMAKRLTFLCMTPIMLLNSPWIVKNSFKKS